MESSKIQNLEHSLTLINKKLNESFEKIKVLENEIDNIKNENSLYNINNEVSLDYETIYRSIGPPPIERQYAFNYSPL